MAEATFRHGDPLMVDYTAEADIDAGEVVLIGNTAGWTCGVAHLDIANGALGALAAGGGVYHVKVASNYAAGTKVYWDDANAVLTSTSTNMSQFGYTVEDSPAANSTIEVRHSPNA